MQLCWKQVIHAHIMILHRVAEETLLMALVQLTHPTYNMVLNIILYQTSLPNLPSTSSSLNDHDVPCIVCYIATRVALLMIPGKYTCPPNWTREYYGYLMVERYNHHRSTFECVDEATDTRMEREMIRMEPYSTMWNLAVAVYHVHHMKSRKK